MSHESASDDRLPHLFDPRGVIVVGASSRPAKFGFDALHNILADGYNGPVFAANLDGGRSSAYRRSPTSTQLREAVLTWRWSARRPAANPECCACAAKGVRAAYVISGGYREAGDEGRRAEEELVALADNGILLAGPDGQGLVSTPAGLCAQIVGPYPPPGAISIASQSGNLVSSFSTTRCRPASAWPGP